jgi:DNA-binding NarL/FixJ family response regulator
MSEPLAVVLIVGGYPLHRQGTRLALEAFPGLAVCGETGDTARARELCERHRPDFIVLDLSGAAGVALGVLRDFRRLHPPVHTLVLSEVEDVVWLERVFQAGASGFVSKLDGEGELANGIMQLGMTGERFVSRRMSHLLMENLKAGRMIKSAARATKALSPREMEVFLLVGKGQGATAAARSLGISVKTVETHHRRIREKLGLRDGEDLKRRAAEWVAAGGKGRRKALLSHG